MKQEKTCPLCAEDVKAAAHVCRFCGHSFEGGTSGDPRAEDSSDGRSRGRRGRRWRIVVAVVLALATAAAATTLALARNESLSTSTADSGENALDHIRTFCDNGGVDGMARLKAKRKESSPRTWCRSSRSLRR